LHLDARQVEEFLLTATQTLPGVAALLALRFPRWLRWTLLGLFAVQFALRARPDGAARLCGICTAIAVATLIRNRRHIPPTLTAPSQPWPSTQTTSRPHVRPSTVTAAC
jgi:cation:H+ antiporter